MKKVNKRILWMVLAVALLAVVSICLYGRSQLWGAGLNVTVLDTGKSDCILVEADGRTMMIDAGYEENGEQIVDFLRERGIVRLDYLLITHFDKDHIGGADQVLRAVEVGEVIQPNGDKDSKQYRQYTSALAGAGLTARRLSGTEEFALGEASVRLLAAQRTDYEGDNDFSIMAELRYGERSFLFAGDAEDVRLTEYLEQAPGHFDFLKVPHHGRLGGRTEEFLRAVSPNYAVITCSRTEGAEWGVTQLLQNMGCETYLTTEGDVMLRCDGARIRIWQE